MHGVNLLQGEKGWLRTLNFPISIACLQSYENSSAFTLQLYLFQSGMSPEERQMTYLFVLTQRKTENAWQGAELNLLTCVEVVCSTSRDLAFRIQISQPSFTMFLGCCQHS